MSSPSDSAVEGSRSHKRNVFDSDACQSRRLLVSRPAASTGAQPLLAAIDGHAKNFSVFIEAKGFYRITPRYDVLSAHPVMGHGTGRLSSHKVKMAMAIDGKNRHYKWSEIRREHFEQTAQRCHLPDAPALIDNLIDQTPKAIAEVAAKLPSNFPDDLAKSIFDGLMQAANALGNSPSPSEMS